MKKIFVFSLIIIMLFSFSAAAQEAESADLESENLESLDLSQGKSFSDSAREELLGIASQYESPTNIENIEIDNSSFNLTGNGTQANPGLQLLSDLNFNTDYDQEIINDEIVSETQLQLEYAINSRALIRAGYSLANREWWEVQRPQTEAEAAGQEPNLSINSDQSSLLNNNSERVFREENEVSRSLGVAYQTSDRFTVSADFIENNDLNSFNNDFDLNANSTVFGLQYNDRRGTIRASYQVDLNDELTQRITGVELDFNNLATFSASYKLLDPADLESTLRSQTAWDLGLGVNINENYGLNLGYEIIQSENEEEDSERNISASFEINF
ncbi:hypothetical protein C8C77_102146 [Halanaerobium saccharolyticum]|uniref:Uncharacterized protein n=1 Tax=Halanaerobium saccharolyticum TaxID=43595 RepID=A0A4V3G5Z3_9FIRM|nr:hypothetical protein [Halanaerobium saccharolyticum]RAK09782.1 hypothetical protein C7958_10652 [Halanaerobium saccharolyticum]TDW07344.1 hypothetical protein C8C77_102146 [Halanaerobium saccharolyticum]TDX61223.1 hypothetical protein C7956_10653 [Halanaerobium saccharolyticum]